MGSDVISLIKKIGYQRGAERELVVDMTLAEMKRDSEIVNFYKTSDMVDMFQGIDFCIITINGETFPLQVKSSWAGLRKHLKEFPDIPVMIVESEDCMEDIKNKIRDLIRS
jgi:hypothetical protein